MFATENIILFFVCLKLSDKAMSTKAKKKVYSKKDLTQRLPIENVSAQEQAVVEKKQKKRYRMKDLTQELATERARNARLMAELEQSQRLNDELMALHAEGNATVDGMEDNRPPDNADEAAPSNRWDDARERRESDYERENRFGDAHSTITDALVGGHRSQAAWNTSEDGTRSEFTRENRVGGARRQVPAQNLEDNDPQDDNGIAETAEASNPWNATGEAVGERRESDYERERRLGDARGTISAALVEGRMHQAAWNTSGQGTRSEFTRENRLSDARRQVQVQNAKDISRPDGYGIAGEAEISNSWDAAGEGRRSDVEGGSPFGDTRRMTPGGIVETRRNQNDGNTSGNGTGSEFGRENRLCSTRRIGPNVEESRLYTSINQLSIASLSVPECKPAEDGEIHRHSFEAWKDLLSDSMILAGIEDEFTKYTVFKVKAGARLLEIFKNTKSSSNDPDVVRSPFANAMARLKSYFGSGSDVMLMRRKLALLTQKPGESDLSYITRVGSMAHLCDFDDTKEFEQIVATVAEHATNREVRTVALKMLSRNQSFTDLIDKVREIEAIKLNEEFVRKKYQKAESNMVASVSASTTRSFRNPAGQLQQRSFQNYGNRPLRGAFRAPRGRQSNVGSGPYLHPSREPKCWRCNSVYHDASVCSHQDKTCIFCGRRGHIRRACRSRAREMGTMQSTREPVGSTPPTIAAIDEANDDSKPVEPVSVPTEF